MPAFFLRFRSIAAGSGRRHGFPRKAQMVRCLSQAQIGIVLGGMMLARSTAKIAISISAGIRPVRLEDFRLTLTLLEVAISQKSTVPQTISMVP